MTSSSRRIYRSPVYPLKEAVSSATPHPRALLPVPLLCVMAGTIFWTGPRVAAGQDAPPTGGDSLQPIPLPPLVVRVLFSPVRIESSPFSVSVLSRDALGTEKVGLFMEESLQAIPGLQIQNRFNLALGERVSMRGQGSRAQFGVRGLQVVLDGVPATLPDGQSTLDHVDGASLGRVEVLRGPASALYGNGAGGVLRLETRPPSTDPFQWEGTLLAGTDGLSRVSSFSSGSVGATGYLLSLGAQDFDGFRPRPAFPGRLYGGAQRKNLHGAVATEAGPGQLHLSLNFLDLRSENPGSLTREQWADGLRDANPFNIAQGTGKDITQGQMGVSWTGRTGAVRATVSGFGVYREVWNPIPPAIIDLRRMAGGLRTSVEWESLRDGVRIRWMVGGEMGFQRDLRRNYENLEGDPGASVLHQRETVLGSGGFTQAILEFPSQLTALAALRYHRAGFRVRDRLQAAGDPDDSGSRAMGALSPSLGISLPLMRDLRLKASVSSFFQTPTTTELGNRPSGAGGFNPELEPQKGWAAEAGIRFTPGGPGHVEATLFQTWMSDELVPFEIADAPGRVYFRNAGRSTYRGLEISWDTRLFSELGVRGAYTFLDARFRRYRTGSDDFGGRLVPGNPRHNLETVLAWEGGRLPLGESRAFAEIRWRYRGSVPVDDGNTDAADAYSLLEVRGGLRDIQVGRVSLSPFGGVGNILNRRYVTAVSINAFGGRFFDPGPPRSAYIGVRILLGSVRDPES